MDEKKYSPETVVLDRATMRDFNFEKSAKQASAQNDPPPLESMLAMARGELPPDTEDQVIWAIRHSTSDYLKIALKKMAKARIRDSQLIGAAKGLATMIMEGFFLPIALFKEIDWPLGQPIVIEGAAVMTEDTADIKFLSVNKIIPSGKPRRLTVWLLPEEEKKQAAKIVRAGNAQNLLAFLRELYEKKQLRATRYCLHAPTK